MKHVILPDNTPRRLPFYLAMEEYVARQRLGDGDELFFMWQVDPTVIFGRNQIIDNEVNIDYCRRNSIEMYRRKSGGGCVFANRDNIMFSYITPCVSTVATTFARYTSMIVDMLRSLGLDASASSRNDILIGERKVSGNAFYHIPGRSIVHGTMLYDTDRTSMTAAITPSATKLKGKGVDSVRSRITTISEHTDIGIEQFKAYTISRLCDAELHLTQADVAAIELIEQTYYDPHWIYRKSSAKGVRTNKNLRIEGAGEFQLSVVTDPEGIITALDLTGDYFLLSDIDDQLLRPLIGVRRERHAIERALRKTDVSQIIFGLTNADAINLLS